MESDEQMREKAVRRRADRQDLLLQKSRRAVDYGRYSLRDRNNTVVCGDKDGVSIDEIERFLLNAPSQGSAGKAMTSEDFPDVTGARRR